jgi:hypothetical protein
MAATRRRSRFYQKTVSLPPARISFFRELRRGVANFWIVFHTILSGACFRYRRC